MTESTPPFVFSATVDFPDDIRYGPYSPELLEDLIMRLRGIGVRRLYWIYYGDTNPRSPMAGNMYSRMEYGDRSIAAIGEPVRAAAQVAHRHGMELYAVLKPFNGGLSSTVPEGDPAASRAAPGRIGGRLVQAIPFIEQHPEMRVRRGSVAGVSPTAPVREIRLRKADAAPTRVRGDDLEIWVSDDNFGYHRSPQTFDFRDSVEPAPDDVVDYYGRVVTAAGDPVRTLTLGNLNLTDRYVLVTTRFKDVTGDFANTALGMVEAIGVDGVAMPIVVATRTAMGRSPRDFHTQGLEFDSGFGPQLTTLDVATDPDPGFVDPGMWWHKIHTGGVVAFARGKNEYLPATPCEMYREVRTLWDDWVDYLVASGVDGIDIRVSHHGSLVDEPQEYGFNQPVIDAYEKTHGVVPSAPDDMARLAGLRGRHFTDFVRDTSRRVRSTGVKLQAHLHTEAFRPAPCHGQMMGIPPNIDFEWATWLAEGLLDGVTLRSSWFEGLEDPVPGRSELGSLDTVFEDPVVLDVLERCATARVPVYLNRYIDRAVGIDDYLADFERSVRDPRIDGFDVYEAAHILRPVADGSALEEYEDRMRLLAEKADELGLR